MVECEEDAYGTESDPGASFLLRAFLLRLRERGGAFEDGDGFAGEVAVVDVEDVSF